MALLGMPVRCAARFTAPLSRTWGSCVAKANAKSMSDLPSTSSQYISGQVVGNGLGKVLLNRPEALNAMNRGRSKGVGDAGPGFFSIFVNLQFSDSHVIRRAVAEMVSAVGELLHQWRSNERVTAVLLESCTPKSFCAGNGWQR